MAQNVNGLNPYSNGIWIEQEDGSVPYPRESGLNPYSNGIWIEPGSEGFAGALKIVLILILMEYG